MSFETISVIGLGYIGLPTAAMFAAYGKKVIGVDVNQNAVDTINRGEIHIVEPDLDAIGHKAVTDGKLKAVLKPELAGDLRENHAVYIVKAISDMHLGVLIAVEPNIEVLWSKN